MLVSWVETHVDARELKGRECDRMAAYRRVTGQNPSCQFAVIPDFEQLSVNNRIVSTLAVCVC